MRTDYPDLVKLGRLDEVLKMVTEDVRKNPSEVSLRIFMFQLLSVLGDWKRAMNQLDVAAGLDDKCLLMAAMYNPALAAEPFRSEVRDGKRDPLIFGEPAQWVGLLLQANKLQGEGKTDAANEMRAKAFEEAPATPGIIDGESFEWIADADQCYGPMIEAIIQNKYYWVPFQNIKNIVIEPPSDLRDMVWAPAQFVLTNGGEAFGLIPVRYPGSELSKDNLIRLSRKTDWVDESGVARGIGQRLFATDAGEKSLLEIRRVLLTQEKTDEPAEGGSE